MKRDNSDREAIYLQNKVIDFSDQMLDRGISPLEIAAAQMVHAMKIYRSILPEDEYDALIASVYSTRKNIQPFIPPTLN